MAKRACSIFIYDEKERKVCESFMTFDDGKHWKKILRMTDTFKGDNLEWLSDFFTEAEKQLKGNGYTVVIAYLDFINPMTQRKLIDNGK